MKTCQVGLAKGTWREVSREEVYHRLTADRSLIMERLLALLTSDHAQQAESSCSLGIQELLDPSQQDMRSGTREEMRIIY